MYDGVEDGKRIATTPIVFCMHKCPECGIVVSNILWTLEDGDNWSGGQPVPKYCYMCGASMGAADDTRDAGVVA